MKGVYFVFIILILILSNSCSEKWIMDVDPRDYEFENDYIQTKWEYYLDLEDCKKVEYLDSIYRPILLKWNQGLIDSCLDSLLLFKEENYYYWLFREVQRLTNKYPTIMLQHGSYGGTHNHQFLPLYSSYSRDSLNQFDSDIQAWKDSLGCE